MTLACTDRVALDEWHVVSAVDELPVDTVHRTRLLGTDLGLRRRSDGEVAVWIGSDAATRLPVEQHFGYVWATLGKPARKLFAIPEFAEPDRRNMNAATFGVAVSAPRAIENFLDLGHFPYVHTDLLGAEPHTEVKEYDVSVSPDRSEILATRCRFYQPRASQVASAGYEVEYVYRVPHPYCSILYKDNALDRSRQDVIALFLQPTSEEHVNAYMLLSMIDDISSDITMRMFQQMIFAQDKPILENQIPRRLPLDLKAEIPARCDASSIAYRRWLRERGVCYGTIPA